MVFVEVCQAHKHLQLSIEYRRAAKTAPGPESIVRNAAETLPAQTRIKPFGVTAGHSIEHQQSPAGTPCLDLDGAHEGGSDATPTGGAMHLHLGDVGPVGLVVGRGEDELNSADDGLGSGILGHQDDALTPRGAG